MNKLRIFLLSVLTCGMPWSVTIMAQEQYQVGVCDWMVLKRQKLGEFQLAKDLGCDGVEMDMGGLGKREMFDNKMRNPEDAARFKFVADSLGIRIGAIAMSGFYGQDLTKRDNYLALMGDCFDTMDKMGHVKVAFLPWADVVTSGLPTKRKGKRLSNGCMRLERLRRAAERW